MNSSSQLHCGCDDNGKNSILFIAVLTLKSANRRIYHGILSFYGFIVVIKNERDMKWFESFGLIEFLESLQ